MANSIRKKSNVPKPPDPEQIIEDKVEEVPVKEIIKDDRTIKMLGAVCILVTLFLLTAFISYLFTWQEDQDKIHRFGIKIFSVDDVRMSNLLGVLGAYFSHLFIYKGFGIASFLVCSFFFVLGINLLARERVFSLARNLKYVLVGLIVISVTAAYFFGNARFPFGGAAGNLLNLWFVKWVGRTGTGLLLSLSVLLYVIWRFNPRFKIPRFHFASASKPQTVAPSALQQEAEVDDTTEPDEEELPSLMAEDDFSSNNKLKTEGEELVLNVKPADTDSDPLNEFAVTEKEEPPAPESILADDELPAEAEPELVEEDEPVLEVSQPQEEQESEETTSGAVVVIPASRANVVSLIAADTEQETQQSTPVEDNLPEDDIKLEIADVKEEEEDEQINAAADQLEPYEPTLDLRDYKYPPLDLLETHGSEKIVHDPAELENHKNQILSTLKNYDISIQRISATVGPTVTLYEIVPSPGVRISRIKNLEDDIALSLAALGIRIIAPIPGKGTIGIEVPNVKKTVVSMKTLLASEKFQHTAFSLPIAIGKKIDNENFIVDLASMPHLLMAGATGQGKSVGINALLVSLLYKKHPSQLKFVLVDPKKVELSIYRLIEKHFLAKLPGEEEAIITDTKKVVYTLNALCIEMDNRYDLLKDAHCRNIKEYNEKFTRRRLNPNKGHQYLPFIVLVVDEFADLIMTAGKEVEMPIARLAQLARAVGIHLIIATQRPSVNIITGTIKANFPARMAFKVSSKIDSRTILDAGGAEQLIGKGDMLVNYNGEITRLQCAFVDTPEVEKIVEYIGKQRGYPTAFNLPEYIDEKDAESREIDLGDRDPLFNDAARLIVQNQMGSTSLIQRRMKLGYNRAGRLMDQLEAAGIVGPNLGSKAREVNVKTESDLEEILQTL